MTSETKTATRTARRPSTASSASNAFTAEERAAMKDRSRELKSTNADGESDVLAKIAEMSEHDRELAERLHALVKVIAPALTSRTWYGMPAYAKDSNTLFFFKCADKFKARYATLGFSDKARLDEPGSMWPTEFALKEWSPANEERISALIKRAIS